MSDVVTIRIRSDQSQKIKDRQMNLSEFVREKLDEEFETAETLEQEKKELQEKIKEIETKKEKIQKKQESVGNEEEKEFLKFAKKNLEERPGELTENLRVYNQKFHKRISLEKFKEMLK